MQRTTNPFRVLIVDDDAITRTLLQDHLAADGHEVISVETAAEAVTAIAGGDVQIVVTDWLMPHISGLELLRWVRRQTLPRQPHFVMLTANTGHQQLAEAFEAGVDDFLAKPFCEIELSARFLAWSRLVSAQDEAARLMKELREANSKLAQIASHDDLTGLSNRRSAMEQLTHCLHLARRHGQPLACALLDVDHFKLVNDVHGHATGDEVLRHLSKLLRQNARGGDMCCRVSGDEFLVILPYTSLEDGSAWAERFTRNLAGEPLHHKGLTIPVTVSLGLTLWSDPMTAEQLLESADEALYGAKRAGRAVVRVRS